MQSPVYTGEIYVLNRYIHIHTKKRQSGLQRIKQTVSFNCLRLYQNNILYNIIEFLFHGVSAASSMQNVMCPPMFLQLSSPIPDLQNPEVYVIYCANRLIKLLVCMRI